MLTIFWIIIMKKTIEDMKNNNISYNYYLNIADIIIKELAKKIKKYQ